MIFVCVAGAPSKFPRLSTIQNHPRPLSSKLSARRQNISQQMNTNIRRGHRHIGWQRNSTPLPFELPCLPCKSPMAGTHDGRRREHSGSLGRSQRDCAADADVTLTPSSSCGDSKNSALTHQARSYDNQTTHMAASSSQHGLPTTCAKGCSEIACV